MEELNEIFYIDTDNCSQRLTPAKLKPIIVCWMCFNKKKGPNISQFISPCKCTGSTRFVHFQCLETYVNNKDTRIFKNKLCCPFCGVHYPLEIKRKASLLAYCRETLGQKSYQSIFNVFLIIGLITILYQSVLYFWELHIWHLHHIISLIIIYVALFFCAFSIVMYITFWSKSVYDFYKGYKNFEEFKVIKQSDSISETEL